MAKKKKIKIPKSVLDLRLSPKKFAKKHDIRIKGKSKKERKHNMKRLQTEYSEAALNGLNKASKILAENSPDDSKKLLKVKDGVDNIIMNPAVMKRIANLYRKNPDQYPNMKYLPAMIMATLLYYRSESISEEEKELGKNLDAEALTSFCEKILKKEIKRYEKLGLDEEMAYAMATAIPTTKLFKNNRTWYKRLIQQIYDIAGTTEVDVDLILKAVRKLDKKKGISKKDFEFGFFSEFILQKASNKHQSFTENQKDVHEKLSDKALTYMDGLKPRHIKEMLKLYIKRRKRAESFKNDTKRVIKFTDHANSNSPYPNIKQAIQSLIEDNSSNEIYLS